jgi:hypothetical protein
MNSSTKRIFFGVALILLGGLFLVQQIFHLPIHLGVVLVALVFALAGFVFLYVMFSGRDNWWAAIPGMVLLGLGALIASSEFFPRFADRFGGSLFLAFIGLAFVVVLIMKRDAWWAIIPAGVLFTLAVVAGLSNVLMNGFASGAIFFLGIGLTFAVVGLMPVGRTEKWPWIPSAICLVLGTVLMMGSESMLSSVFGIIWPVLLVLGGGYLIFRSLKPKNE